MKNLLSRRNVWNSLQPDECTHLRSKIIPVLLGLVKPTIVKYYIILLLCIIFTTMYIYVFFLFLQLCRPLVLCLKPMLRIPTMVNGICVEIMQRLNECWEGGQQVQVISLLRCIKECVLSYLSFNGDKNIPDLKGILQQ